MITSKYKKLSLLALISLLLIISGNKFKKKQTQYQLNEEGQIEEVKIDAPGEVAGEQSSTESAELEAEDEFNQDTFAQWSVLENFKAGYRLIYPAGFNADYSFGKIEITPPSNKGRVTVYINDGSFEVKTYNQGLGSKDKKLLEETAKLIQNTFEFTTSPGYNLEEGKQRFN